MLSFLDTQSLFQLRLAARKGPWMHGACAIENPHEGNSFSVLLPNSTTLQNLHSKSGSERRNIRRRSRRGGRVRLRASLHERPLAVLLTAGRRRLSRANLDETCSMPGHIKRCRCCLSLSQVALMAACTFTSRCLSNSGPASCDPV